jgi:hypothetical protein
MNKITVTLDGQALLELQEVLLDCDQAGALAFLEKYIAPSLPRAGTRPCDSTRINPFLLKKDGETG